MILSPTAPLAAAVSHEPALTLVELTKYIVECSSKLESLQGSIRTTQGFFSSQLVSLRSNLRWSCLKLWESAKFRLDYYRKAEEILWRRLYHDIYKFSKSNRDTMSINESLLVEAHFVSGIGFYSSLIIKLRSQHKLNDTSQLIMPLSLSFWPTEETPFETMQASSDLKDFSSISKNTTVTTINGSSPKSNTNQSLTCDADSQIDWARQAIYRSLVYMGDVSRYLIDQPNRNEYRALAIRFYMAAALFNKHYGMPFNQLATIVGNENYALNSVCNYMRCCLRQKPFEGAEGNMRRIFLVNNKIHDDLFNNDLTSSRRAEPVHAVKRLIITFIKLASDLWSGSLCAPSRFHARQESIARLIHTFFELLVECLEFDESNTSLGSEPSKPCHVTPDIMSMFANISIMLIARTQQDIDSPGATCIIYDSTMALTLNLLHYATTRCRKVLTRHLDELEQRCSVNDENVDKHGGGTTDPSERPPSSNVDAYVELDASECMSELEETALSTIDALEISSDLSESFGPSQAPSASANKAQNLIHLDSDDDDDKFAPPKIMSTITDTCINITNKAPTCKSAMPLPNDPSIVFAYSSGALISLNEHEKNKIHAQLHKPDQWISSLPAALLKHTLDDENIVVQDRTLSKNQHLLGLDVSGPVSEKFESFNEHVSTAVHTLAGQKKRQEHHHRQQQSLADKTDVLRAPICGYDDQMSFVYAQTYLPTIKILCDWLQSNSDIIMLHANAFNCFFNEFNNLIDVLNRLTNMFDEPLNDHQQRNSIHREANAMPTSEAIVDKSQDSNHRGSERRYKFNGTSWRQRYPLSVDYPLMTLKPLELAHEQNIDFDWPSELSLPDMGYLCIQCIVAFASRFAVVK